MTPSIIYDQPDLWAYGEMDTVRLAVEIVMNGLDTEDGFADVFGPMHFRFTTTLDTWASCLYDVIRFQSPATVGITVTVHELMHRLNVRARLIPEREYAKDKAMLVNVALWEGLHPPSMAEGDQPDEGLADLLMHYFLGTLRQDDRGRAARAWVDEHLPGWVAEAMKG